MTKNKWPKSDEKTGFGGTLGLEETQGDERRIVPRPTQPKDSGGALALFNENSPQTGQCVIGYCALFTLDVDSCCYCLEMIIVGCLNLLHLNPFCLPCISGEVVKYWAPSTNAPLRQKRFHRLLQALSCQAVIFIRHFPCAMPPNYYSWETKIDSV